LKDHGINKRRNEKQALFTHPGRKREHVVEDIPELSRAKAHLVHSLIIQSYNLWRPNEKNRDRTGFADWDHDYI
jgi:hypothetical protein